MSAGEELAALGISLVGNTFFNVEANNEKINALNLQAKQNELAYLQKKEQTLDLVQQVLDTQAVQSAARGIGPNSPTYTALANQTINTGAKQLKNLDLEKDIYDTNVAISKSNLNKSLFASLFGTTETLLLPKITELSFDRLKKDG